MRNFVKLADIRLGKNYSRTFGPGSVKDLVASFKEHGQLQPVTVGSDGVLAFGFRRYAAAKELGWEEIWADVSDKPSHELKSANLAENLHRKDMSLWEEIVGLRDVYGEEASVREVAKATRMSRSWVGPRLAAWTLPKEYLDQIRLGKVDIGQLRARLHNRKGPVPDACYAKNPTQTEIRDAVTRLVERGRIQEARALTYALGTISVQQLLAGEPE